MEQTTLKALNPVIPVRNMKTTLGFYEEQLGFKKLFDDSGDGDTINYAGVTRDGLCLHLQTMAPDEKPTMPLIRIQVLNIESLYEDYKKKGLIRSGGNLEPKAWGSKDFGLHDLNGAALVFYEDL